MLKSIFQALVSLIHLVGRLPELAAAALKNRRRQLAWNRVETERLDRIRNPSKYLGK